MGLNGRQQRLLLSTLSESLDAGLTFRQYAEGPVVRRFPPTFRAALAEHTNANESVTQAFASMHLVDRAGLALLAAAEDRGELPAALRSLEEQHKQRHELAGQAAKTLFYPCMLLATSAIILPIPTWYTKGFGAYLSAVMQPLLPVMIVLGAVFVMSRLPAHSRPRRLLRIFGAAVPPISMVTWERALATFADVLARCLDAGLSARRALELAAAATEHPKFSTKGAALVEAIDNGASLVDAIDKTIPGLPQDYLARIGHGEEVGRLPECLHRLEVQHTKRAQRALTTTLAIAGALVGLFVVIKVASGIIAGWQGYFSALDGNMDSLIR